MDDTIKNILLDKKSSPKVKQNVLLMFSSNTSSDDFLNLLNKHEHLDPFLVQTIKNKICKTHTSPVLKVPIEYIFYTAKPKNEAKRMRMNEQSYTDDYTHKNTHATYHSQDAYTNNTRDTNSNGIRDINTNNAFTSNSHIQEKETMIEEIENKTCLFNLSFMNFSLQCNICGFRFDAEEDGKSKFTLHIDNHTRKERALENAKSISREYFCSMDEFVSSINKLELEVKTKEIQYYKAENSLCDVCRDKIDVEWNDEMDDWVMVDCVCINERDRKFCHRKCVI